MKQIFLDTETTGLVANKDRVVEIAAIAYEEQRLITAEDGGEYHQYINPQCPMPAEARGIHGLDDDFLADKPPFADIADDFLQFIQDSEIIIHNASFDCGFLDAELQRIGKPKLEHFAEKITCSLMWARENLPNIGGYSLDALCRQYNISLSERQLHSAILDTQLLGKVYYRMRQLQGVMDMRTAPLSVEVGDADVIVRAASDEEVAEHNKLLADMADGGGAAPLYNNQD